MPCACWRIGSQGVDEASRAAQDALRLALDQYKAGTADYSSVIIAQAAAYAAAHCPELLSLLSASALLIKALGGGWQGIGAQ